jgi:hypothetical protein
MILFNKINLNKMPTQKILVVGLVAALIFMVRNCQLKDLLISKNGLQIQMYENKVNSFSTQLNEFGEKVSTQDQSIIKKNRELEKELLKNSELSRLNEQIKFESETKIKNFIANYSGDSGGVTLVRDTIIKNGDTNIVVGVPIGTKFKQDTSKWYSVSGSLQENGVKFDSISFKSDFTVNVGLKKVPGYKGWLFGKKEPKVEIINKNPYTDITGMKNIKFQQDKWWQNGWFKFGAGVIAGAVIISQAK